MKKLQAQQEEEMGRRNEHDNRIRNEHDNRILNEKEMGIRNEEYNRNAALVAAAKAAGLNIDEYKLELKEQEKMQRDADTYVMKISNKASDEVVLEEELNKDTVEKIKSLIKPLQ